MVVSIGVLMLEAENEKVSKKREKLDTWRECQVFVDVCVSNGFLRVHICSMIGVQVLGVSHN